MRRFRGLTYAIVLPVLVAVALLRLDLGVLAQVDVSRATPPLIEEVSRLVSKHFYDRGIVGRVSGSRDGVSCRTSWCPSGCPTRLGTTRSSTPRSRSWRRLWTKGDFEEIAARRGAAAA